MAFVNEKISDEDFEKYNFEKINNRWNGGGNPAYDWTVDKDNEVWLRHFYTRQDHTLPDGGFRGEDIWDFYWKGLLMSVDTKKTNVKGAGHNEHFSYTLNIVSINIPEEFEHNQTDILKSLYEAFIIYSAGVIFSEAASCHIDFKYKGASL